MRISDLSSDLCSSDLTYGESDTSIATRVFFNRAEASLALPNYANALRSFEFGAEGSLFPLPGGEARLAIGGGVRTNKLTVDSRRVVGGIETPIDIFTTTRKVTRSEERRVGKEWVSRVEVGGVRVLQTKSKSYDSVN